jgi:hypothetical protein
LDLFGFPWILSSETSLINGLHGIFRGKFFVTALWRKKPGRALKVEAVQKGGIAHGASLLQFLIVSKQLSSDPAAQANTRPPSS